MEEFLNKMDKKTTILTSMPSSFLLPRFVVLVRRFLLEEVRQRKKDTS